jgi:hypothetical protein
MAWDNGMLSSSLSLLAVRLNVRTWLYFESSNSREDCLYLLASAKASSAHDAHQQFLSKFFGSKTFGSEFLVSPPSEISTSFSRTFLAQCFATAADVATKIGYLNPDDFWAEVRSIIAQHEPDARVLSQADLRMKSGRVQFLKSYLAAVMTQPKRKRR